MDYMDVMGIYAAVVCFSVVAAPVIVGILEWWKERKADDHRFTRRR